jgi:regulator of protease activity HflC (stomatin/prohibitin superfamily)
MNELLLRQLIQWASILAFLGMHTVVLLDGAMGGRHGLRTAVAYLLAFDWTLVMGVTAGRSVAGEGTPFWSLHTVGWALLGALLLFLPAWLLFRFGLRFCGIFLLPVMPTDPERRQKAGRTLRAYMWGLNYPFYREEDGELRKLVGSSGSIALREGGPGFVMASSHYAIPITVGTHDTRVGGRGLIFTTHRERPRSLIDLRLQIRAKTVHALTRDGIPVKVMTFVIFQIDRRRAKGEGLYPFNPQAVLAAVHAQGVGPEQEDGEREEIGWDQIVVDRAADLLRGGIARTLLDQLLESENGDGSPPCEMLCVGVTRELAQAMEPLGVHVLAVGLGNIEDEEVLEQRVKSWAARWERRRLEREAQGDAEAIRLIEQARADAQRQMIVAITEAFQQLADTGTPVPAHVIALRFIDVLDDIVASPAVQQMLPETVRDLPARMRLLMEPIAASGGDEAAQ